MYQIIREPTEVVEEGLEAQDSQGTKPALLMQRIKQLESISQERKANSSAKSQATSAQQRAGERKARVNSVCRQAVIIDEPHKIIVNMQKEHQ